MSREARVLAMGVRVLVNDELEAMDLVRALAEVSSERRAQALGYRFDQDRRQSVAAYLLLKDALKGEYGIAANPRIARGPDGKPFLPDYPTIHFNFSHCRNAAACIVADRPVGIDIEEIAPVDWDVARRVLSKAELADVRASADPEEAFARFWTRKEAFVKLSGKGLEDSRLPGLLEHTPVGLFETTVNRARNYVLTTARPVDSPSSASL